jgi:hypothetical protein
MNEGQVPSDEFRHQTSSGTLVAAARGAEEGKNRYLYDALRARTGSGHNNKERGNGREDTETQTETWMLTRGGIGTDRRGVGAETETQSIKDEL